MNIRTPYQNFFLKTEEGKYFLSEINRLIEANHEFAEREPELARDFSQRAKGNREVLEHIQSAVAELKGKPM